MSVSAFINQVRLHVNNLYEKRKQIAQMKQDILDLNIKIHDVQKELNKLNTQDSYQFDEHEIINMGKYQNIIDLAISLFTLKKKQQGNCINLNILLYELSKYEQTTCDLKSISRIV